METYFGYVKAPQDAIMLFEACRVNYLNRIQRRLSDKERSAIRSGSVFVWDEREAGMRRWTDGKSWSASRVSGSFLTYRELESKRKTNSRGSNNPNDLSSEDTDSSESYSSNSRKLVNATEQCRYKHGGLVKQSFSITTTNHQKLHLICYYTKADVISEKLQIPSQDEKLKLIPIPKGMYPETQNIDYASPNNGHHNHSQQQQHHHHHHHHHHNHGNHTPFGSNENRIERSLSPNPYGWQLPQPHSNGSLPPPSSLHHHHLRNNSQHHSVHQHRHSGTDLMQIDTPHSACSTPSISSSPSTTEEDFGDHFRRQTFGLGTNSNLSSQSLPLYPPANYIQPSSSSISNSSSSPSSLSSLESTNINYSGSAPINIPNSSRFTFPAPPQLQFPSSYPPPSSQQQQQQQQQSVHQLLPQDIPWEKIRNSEDQRQLNAIYTTLKL
ncbi:hypothetical protein G9A89_015886 [Geosiphon pyriformis]|nr:hypothetical protein G9A89_015886 [Geosiphon pyriformis]